MKKLAYWENLRDKAEATLAIMPDRPDYPPLLKGLARKRRTIRLRKWIKVQRYLSDRERLVERLRYYNARIFAMKARTSFDIIRRGGLGV